jgi:hypothetical protein
MQSKKIHVKPALYAFIYEELKVIAQSYGYNLVLHGSMARDLDLIAIPWVAELGDVNAMVIEFAEHIGGHIMDQTHEQKYCFPHGRYSYVININRGRDDELNDQQYYLDLSIIPPFNG